MIIYFSGVGYPPEKLFKGKCSLMMSFWTCKNKATKRFIKVYRERKRGIKK